MKDNAIGSIFYGVGFSTPGVLAEAFTGMDSTPQTTGRRLLQDPYHLTAKVVPLLPLSWLTAGTWSGSDRGPSCAAPALAPITA